MIVKDNSNMNVTFSKYDVLFWGPLDGLISYQNLYNFKLDKERKHLLLEPPLDDRNANSPSELESVIFGQGFGGITDLQVGPDGYIYVLAIMTFHNDYRGTIYRIVPKVP